VTRCEVSTLPPTTAALSEGERKDPGGMRTVMGLRPGVGEGVSVLLLSRRMSSEICLSSAKILEKAHLEKQDDFRVGE